MVRTWKCGLHTWLGYLSVAHFCKMSSIGPAQLAALLAHAIKLRVLGQHCSTAHIRPPPLSPQPGGLEAALRRTSFRAADQALGFRV